MTTAIAEVVKAIRDGLPALRKGEAIDRGQDTDWFANIGPYFAKIDDDSLDRLTRYAKRKIKKSQRLQWRPIRGYDDKEFCSENIGKHTVWIRNHRRGWSVDRAIGLVEDCRVLT
jgi:hypothetical protein